MEYEFKDNEEMKKVSWEWFRRAGLLWWANRVLHMVGFAIMYVKNEQTGAIETVIPVRYRYRGFSDEAEIEGYRALTKTLSKLSGNLVLDTQWAGPEDPPEEKKTSEPEEENK